MPTTAANEPTGSAGAAGRARLAPWAAGLALLTVAFGMIAADSPPGETGLERIGDAVGLLGLWTLVIGVPIAAVSSALAGRGRVLTALRWVLVVGFSGYHAMLGMFFAFTPVLCGLWGPAGQPCDTGWAYRAAVAGVALALWATLGAVDAGVARLLARRAAPRPQAGH